MCGCLYFIIPVENNGISNSLSYEEVPVEILDKQVRRLKTKDVASVKVLWRNQKVEEATWEVEEDIKSKYPFLFPALDENALGMILLFLLVEFPKFFIWVCLHPFLLSF